MSSARRAAAACVVLAAVAGTARAQVANGNPGPARRPTIDTIIVERSDIFGPGSGAPPLVARLGDALHMRTTERTIRRALYLDPGMAYDSARVAEAERGLRALAVFRDVRIDTASVDTPAGARFGVVVRTADGWTTKPQLEYRSTAGDVTWQVGIVEENLFGTATLFAVLYGRAPDRDYLSLNYGNQAFLSRRAVFDLRYDNYTDGHAGAWRYGVPFFETTTPRSLLTYGSAGDQRVLVYRAGVLAEEWRRLSFVAGVFAGYAKSASASHYQRLFARASIRREDYGLDSSSASPDRSIFGQVSLGFEAARVRFSVHRRLDSYGRQEDVDLSSRYAVTVTALPRAFGYDPGHAGIGLGGSAQTGREWDRIMLVARARAHGVFTGDGVDSGRVAARLTAAAIAHRQTVLAAIEGAAARDPAPGGEYDLWQQRTGPRLFGAHSFSGTRAYTVTLEDRVALADEVLGLLSIGAAGFLDLGGAWFAGDARRSGGNAGLSIRIAPTRASSGEVFELAGGWRWSSDHTTEGWAFSFGTAYRLFAR